MRRADGAILPIQDIYKDVCCSVLGTFFPVGGLCFLRDFDRHSEG